MNLQRSPVGLLWGLSLLPLFWACEGVLDPDTAAVDSQYDTAAPLFADGSTEVAISIEVPGRPSQKLTYTTTAGHFFRAPGKKTLEVTTQPSENGLSGIDTVKIVMPSKVEPVVVTVMAGDLRRTIFDQTPDTAYADSVALSPSSRLISRDGKVTLTATLTRGPGRGVVSDSVAVVFSAFQGEGAGRRQLSGFLPDRRTFTAPGGSAQVTLGRRNDARSDLPIEVVLETGGQEYPPAPLQLWAAEVDSLDLNLSVDSLPANGLATATAAVTVFGFPDRSVTLKTTTGSFLSTVGAQTLTMRTDPHTGTAAADFRVGRTPGRHVLSAHSGDALAIAEVQLVPAHPDVISLEAAAAKVKPNGDSTQIRAVLSRTPGTGDVSLGLPVRFRAFQIDDFGVEVLAGSFAGFARVLAGSDGSAVIGFTTAATFADRPITIKAWVEDGDGTEGTVLLAIE